MTLNLTYDKSNGLVRLSINYIYVLFVFNTNILPTFQKPFQKISSQVIIKALTKFFTQFGMHKEIQSDQGSNSTSGIFQQVMHQLGLKHVLGLAYHPQSKSLGKIPSDLENHMIKEYCFDNQKEWDKGIHLLFATR